MAGLLLARAGVDVVVLEKHADFFRDFRGDTIHPSTLELMQELGSLDDLLKLRMRRRITSLFNSARSKASSPISTGRSCAFPSSPSCRNGISSTSSRAVPRAIPLSR
jgi:2-polyprenyl-6-methoxyphenol hydroxylase-like FAD-dependent oxidoreductase